MNLFSDSGFTREIGMVLVLTQIIGKIIKDIVEKEFYFIYHLTSDFILLGSAPSP